MERSGYEKVAAHFLHGGICDGTDNGLTVREKGDMKQSGEATGGCVKHGVDNVLRRREICSTESLWEEFLQQEIEVYQL